MITGAWTCLFAPLVGAIVITIMDQDITRRTAGWISTVSTFIAFGGAVVAFIGLLGENESEREHLETAYTWLAAGNFEVGFQILVDPLSIVMMLVVSGVGGLIVWYSMGYMAVGWPPGAIRSSTSDLISCSSRPGTFSSSSSAGASSASPRTS